MANSNVAMYVQTVNLGLQQILPADTTTLKTLITAGSQGSRVSSLMLSSTDTAARDVQVLITRSGTTYLLGTIAVALSSGNTNSAPTVNVFGSLQFPGLPLDANGNPYIDLKAADVLSVACLTTVTAAKAINAVAVCGVF